MTPAFPKTRPPQRQSKTSYTRQSQWLRSSLYRRRNTPVKEHILPSLLTAATASSIKIHRLYRHFDYPLSSTYIQESFDYNPCFLTSTEIHRLHCRFSHPSAEKLYRVLKHSRHNNVNRKAINHLTKYCSYCQKYKHSPGQFKFTLREDLDFNHSVYVDIIYINGSLVLHIINEATRY